MEKQEMYEFDDDAGMCQHKRIEPHECPYRSEIEDDYSLCTCCEKCTDQCNDDI